LSQRDRGLFAGVGNPLLLSMMASIRSGFPLRQVGSAADPAYEPDLAGSLNILLDPDLILSSKV